MVDNKFTFPSESFEVKERSLVIDEEAIANADESSATPLFTPTSFNAAKDIVETLVLKKTVIVSIDKLTTDSQGMANATRLIDYLCGATCALHGRVSKINKYTFYFSVKNSN